MKIVPIGRYRAKDIEVVLRHLLARCERGELKGLAVCAMDEHQGEEISFSGDYRQDPAHALSAAHKMSRRVNQIQDAMEVTGAS